MTDKPAPTPPSLVQVARLVEIMKRLRGPGGCPWDIEQTHASIKPELIEECYEVVDAIDAGDMSGLREELGDVLLHVIFHSQIAQEQGDFDLEAVAQGVCDKLVRRHPHVFGEVKADTVEQVLSNWHAIKQAEKPERKGLFDGIPKQLPALMQAQELKKKAARVGFDWVNSKGVLDKVREELGELEDDLHVPERAAEELGDVLFTLAVLAGHLKLDAEQVLRAANQKFVRRFEGMQAHLSAAGKALDSATPDEMNAAWDAVKAQERSAAS